MNSPPLTTLLLSAAGSGAGGYELFLNRIGINSIDIPREKVFAEPGTGLVLRFLNRGAPIHITVTSANASMFTDFFHENMYIVDEAVLSIPIRKESSDGTFDLEIIAGYGAVKAALPVFVQNLQRMRPKVQEEYPLQPVARGRPHLLMVTMGIALILYSAWIYSRYRVSQYCIFYHSHCWCTLHMVPSQIALPALVLLGALVVDRLFGDPHSAFHPVALLGRFIGWWGRPDLFPTGVQRFAGVVFWVITAALFTLPFYLVERIAPWFLYLPLGAGPAEELFCLAIAGGAHPRGCGCTERRCRERAGEGETAGLP